MVRLKDIAIEAGVSMMTVSKALRDGSDISTATRDRIRAIAARLRYVPDVAARTLRAGKTGLLGLVIPATTDPVFARVMLGIEEEAHRLGYDLCLMHSLGKVEREDGALRRLIARRVEGILISPVYRREETSALYRRLKEENLPVVLLGHPAAFCADFPGVATDDVAASAAVTRHLIECGHREIAFMAGPAMSPWAAERLEGYHRAHREAGIPVGDHLVFHAGSTIEEGGAAALQFAQEGRRATAIQAANDLVAIGVGAVLLDQGLRIPQDLALAGFGNLLVAEHFRVPLTTVRQPKLRMGVVAMDMMARRLRGESVETRRIPGELVIRRSSEKGI